MFTPLLAMVMLGAVAATDITTPLRIMPLGASVTFGVGSTTGDSYRKDLLGLLTSQNGATVEYVGTERSGDDFSQNQCEAFPGFVIAQLGPKAASSVPVFKPNVVLADLGTNNCNKGGTVPDAGANVTAIIRRIYADSPGATVVLTTLLANAVAAQDACRRTVNPQYEQLVSQLAAEGERIVLVDMRNPPAPLVGLTTADLNGTRHPNDGGYVKMAAIWHSGIVEAAAKGFLVPPAKAGSTGSDAVTSALAGNATRPGASSKPGSVATPTPAAVTTSSGSRAVPGSLFRALARMQ